MALETTLSGSGLGMALEIAHSVSGMGVASEIFLLGWTWLWRPSVSLWHGHCVRGRSICPCPGLFPLKSLSHNLQRLDLPWDMQSRSVTWKRGLESQCSAPSQPDNLLWFKTFAQYYSIFIFWHKTDLYFKLTLKKNYLLQGKNAVRHINVISPLKTWTLHTCSKR